MRRALIVATSRYLHEEWPDLKSPARGAEAAHRVLADSNIGRFDVEILANADCSAILNGVFDFFDSAEREDFLFAFFSGHSTLGHSGRLYLAATNTDHRRLPPTGISTEYLAEQIEQSPARQIVILMDCSFAGRFQTSLFTHGSDDRVVILTTGSTRMGHDEPPGFADIFFDGLQSGRADRDNDGVITVREAFDYAVSGLRDANVDQAPQLRTGGTGDVILCRAPAGPNAPPPPKRRVFISYVREDSEAIDRLAHALRGSGFDVWLDRTDLLPGMNWQSEIKSAIQAGDYFIACFSPRYAAKQVSYMNEELIVAIEQLRRMPRTRRWFIPVMLEKCDIPELPIGLGETLDNLHYADFSRDWDAAFQTVVRSLSLE